MYAHPYLRPNYPSLVPFSNFHGISPRTCSGPDKPSIHGRLLTDDKNIILDKLIKLLNKRHMPGISEPKVRRRLNDFLCFSRHHVALSPGEKEKRMSYFRYVTSSEFIETIKHDFSLDNFFDHLSEEYGAYLAFENHGNICEKEFAEKLFNLAIEAKDPKRKTTRPLLSFRTRVAILEKFKFGVGNQMAADLLYFFQKGTSGTFKLFLHFLSADETNLAGHGFELRLGRMLENGGYSDIEFSYHYKHGEVDVVAKKDNQKYFFEAKSSEDKLKKEQIQGLITFADESNAIPIIVINKESRSISTEKVKEKLGDVAANPRLRVLDKHLNQIVL